MQGVFRNQQRGSQMDSKINNVDSKLSKEIVELRKKVEYQKKKDRNQNSGLIT